MRVMQVGLGGFGRSWAEVARDAEGIALTAVVDPVPEARAWATETIGLPPEACFATLGDALATTNCDAVLVITPPETHRALAEQALAAGRHVLVEKPLATTLPDAVALVDAAAAAGKHLIVSQNYRFRAPVRAIQGLVADGTIGDLTAVRMVCRRDTRTLWPPDNFRYAMRHPYLIDMAVHHLDMLRAMTGREVGPLYARSWPVPDSPYRHDPTLVAVMGLDNGASATVEGSWAAHGEETSWNGVWELTGEKGRIRWAGGDGDPASGDLTLERWGEPVEPIAPSPLAYPERVGTLQSLRAAVSAGRPAETSGDDNVHSLALVLGCVRSIERQDLVDVPALLREARGQAAAEPEPAAAEAGPAA
ncbi:MAG: hypothetical protein AVDCRST_MAG49-564 [uncultured Thermomicrobiales bacterium]|uniref:Gfo/Idh/MocA family oxidoreductase n=1 Tax=uncultured Thermomicrobiales bacterium TaxID=1645740 RepID=A0A6J4U1S7_9BACT|nr:MAG: hypothetical protein AVDCRST_MAG49-564 [uncultured Thermomicrobiales bacterium]